MSSKLIHFHCYGGSLLKSMFCDNNNDNNNKEIETNITLEYPLGCVLLISGKSHATAEVGALLYLVVVINMLVINFLDIYHFCACEHFLW